jgi:hypothetical protein
MEKYEAINSPYGKIDFKLLKESARKLRLFYDNPPSIDFLVGENLLKSANIVSPYLPLYPRVAKRDQTDVSLFHAILLSYDIKQYCGHNLSYKALSATIGSHLPSSPL